MENSKRAKVSVNTMMAVVGHGVDIGTGMALRDAAADLAAIAETGMRIPGLD